MCYLSCGNKKEQKAWEKKTYNMVEKWVGQKLVLPSSVEIINNPKNQLLEKLLNEPLKIVSYIDGTCSVCINSLLFWDEFSKKISSENIHCPILLYIHTDNVEDFKKDIIDKMEIDIPCFYDKDSEFKHQNGLYDQRFQVALLDHENKVILIGNPTLNDKLSDLYLETIKQADAK